MARNSQAHAAIDRIIDGDTYDLFVNCAGVPPVGVGFEDGSAIEKAAQGWQVSACIVGCDCTLGKRATRAVAKAAAAEYVDFPPESYAWVNSPEEIAWRHKDGLVTFPGLG